MKRVVVGAVLGLAFYGIGTAPALFRLAFLPSVAGRATQGTVVAMAAFAALFALGGAAAAGLAGVRSRLLRYIAIGAISGALMWSYLTATWPLTARSGAGAPPTLTTKAAVGVGAAAGALAGIVLLSVVAVRSRLAVRSGR